MDEDNTIIVQYISMVKQEQDQIRTLILTQPPAPLQCVSIEARSGTPFAGQSTDLLQSTTVRVFWYCKRAGPKLEGI